MKPPLNGQRRPVPFRAIQCHRPRPAHAEVYQPRLESLETRILPSSTQVVAEHLAPQYGQIPLSFEANQGQADAQVQFLAHGQGYGLFLTPTEAVLSLSRPAHPGAGAPTTLNTTLDLRLLGANATPQVTGVDQLAAVSNYFIGNDPRQWHANVPTYAKVAYHAVYPGIDLIYYGNQQQLEYDFDLAPGADPHAIRLAFDGALGLTLDGDGNLVVQTAGGDVVEHAPVLYQKGPAETNRVAGHYVLLGEHQVGFAVGAYDAHLPLIIDPTLSYSTYLGGTSDDQAQGIAVDASGNAYVTGYTSSFNFPTTAGAFQTTNKGQFNAFVTKLNTGGTALVYSTYLGGSGSSYGFGITVDGSGNAYVAGFTGSRDFPTTAGAFQTTNNAISFTSFVTKLNAGGTALVYSTYLGGNEQDYGTGIAVDTSGNAYVTGYTNSSYFPTTAGALQTSLKGSDNAFVTKLNAGGTGLVYSTYLGGSGDDFSHGVAVDASGNAYVTGFTRSTNFPTTAGAFQSAPKAFQTAFVTKLNAEGTALVYSTYLGGSSSEVGNGIAVDASGNAYVSGAAYSNDFPTTAGAFQTTKNGYTNAFVTKLNGTGTALVYSTYLGGSGSDAGNGVAVDASGKAYVTGYTTSFDFPTTAGAFQTTKSGYTNAFVTKLNGTATALVYSTYLGANSSVGEGGNGNGIAVDAADNAYVTGYTYSSYFPTTAGAFQTSLKGSPNAFVAKFTLGGVATHFQISTPAGTTAGVAFTATVTALDDANNVVTSYTGTVHFTSSDGQAVLPGDYTFTNTDQGAHGFAVTLKTAGSQTITVADTANGSIQGMGTVMVTAAAAATLTLSGFPSPSTAGVPGDMTVAAYDAYGNVATGYTGTVHFSSSDGHAVLPADYAFTAADAGTHTFTATLTKAGNQTLTAADTVNGALTGTQGGIVVEGAALDHFGFLVPVVVTAGSPFDGTVLALDAYNNFATYTGTVSFTSTDNDPGVVLPPPYTFTTADAGAHVFSDGFTLITEGLQTLTVTDQATGIAWSVNVLVQASDAPAGHPGKVGTWVGISPSNAGAVRSSPEGETGAAPNKVVALAAAEDEWSPVPPVPTTTPPRPWVVPAAVMDLVWADNLLGDRISKDLGNPAP